MKDICSGRLVLRLMPPSVLRATVEGDLKTVSDALELSGVDEWGQSAWLAQMRLDQLASEPAYAPWSVRAIALAATLEMVGYINCHAPPRQGRIELGYEIFDRHRRNGYASEAVRALLAWARCQDVSEALFSVAPANAESLAIVMKLGATKIGSQIDEKDGLEDIYQLHL